MGISLLTAIEITECYPDNILIDAKQDEKTGKWLGTIYRLKDGVIHKKMVHQCISDEFSGYDTKEKCIYAIEDLILAMEMKIENLEDELKERR